MFARLKLKLRRFRSNDEGSIVNETVIMFPLLFFAVMSTFVFFDAYRNQAINLKANYTISDAFSREFNAIDNTYMINSWNLHRFLTNSRTLTSLRVSLVQYTDDDGYRVVWSRTKGGGDPVTDGTLAQINMDDTQIPIMPHLERLVVVHTAVDYEPRFSIGLGDFTFENIVFTRPRVGQGLCYNDTGTLEGRICALDS